MLTYHTLLTSTLDESNAPVLSPGKRPLGIYWIGVLVNPIISSNPLTGSFRCAIATNSELPETLQSY
jgi:hypothetical protein